MHVVDFNEIYSVYCIHFKEMFCRHLFLTLEYAIRKVQEHSALEFSGTHHLLVFFCRQFI